MASPALAVGDQLIGVIKGLVYGQQVQSTFHWRLTGIPAGYTLSNFVLDMSTDILPEYALCMSNSWSALALYARRLFPSPTRGQELAPGTTVGDVASAALPPSVAAVLSRYTNAPGPKGRGRVFMPAVPASFATAGLVNVTGKGVYDNFIPWLDQIWPTTLGATLEPVLWRKPSTTTDIELAVTQTVLRSQRRREIGVGI